MKNEPDCVTISLRREVDRCENMNDIRALLEARQNWYLNWQAYINQLVDESGLSYSKLAERCGVSKTSLKRWCQKGDAPKSRDTYIKLGFGFGMNSREVNELLTRYGGYHGLYPKDCFDAVCIFLLNKSGRNWEDARALYSKCSSLQIFQEQNEAEELKTIAIKNRISLLDSDEDFTAFIASHPSCFSASYKNLQNYVQEFLISGQLEDEGKSIHAICLDRGIPSHFEVILSRISVGQLPRRERLIALALYLDMTAEEMGELLRLANMEPLCPRSRLECVLLYALQQMALLHPEFPLSNAMQLLSVTENAETRLRCRKIVKEYTENHYRCEEDEMDSVLSYVRDILTQLDLDEAEELLELI